MIFLLSPISDKPVRRDATILHFVVGLSLIAIGVVCLGFYWFSIVKHQEIPADVSRSFGYMGLASLAAGIVVFFLSVTRRKWLRQQRNSASLHSIEVTMLAIIAALFTWQKILIGAGVFAFMTLALSASVLWERRHRHGPADTAIGEDGIHLTGGRQSKFLHWWEVEKILLRHGVLTIEGVGNRIYQRHVLPVHFDISTFEEHCARHIAASTEKRRKADW